MNRDRYALCCRGEDGANLTEVMRMAAGTTKHPLLPEAVIPVIPFHAEKAAIEETVEELEYC
jgi:hypothetical protein